MPLCCFILASMETQCLIYMLPTNSCQYFSTHTHAWADTQVTPKEHLLGFLASLVSRSTITTLLDCTDMARDWRINRRNRSDVSSVSTTSELVKIRSTGALSCLTRGDFQHHLSCTHTKGPVGTCSWLSTRLRMPASKSASWEGSCCGFVSRSSPELLAAGASPSAGASLSL